MANPQGVDESVVQPRRLLAGKQVQGCPDFLWRGIHRRKPHQGVRPSIEASTGHVKHPPESGGPTEVGPVMVLPGFACRRIPLRGASEHVLQS